jgi:hypothetical protein
MHLWQSFDISADKQIYKNNKLFSKHAGGTSVIIVSPKRYILFLFKYYHLGNIHWLESFCVYIFYSRNILLSLLKTVHELLELRKA